MGESVLYDWFYVWGYGTPTGSHTGVEKNMVGGFLKKYRNVSIVQGIILIVG